MKLVIRFINFHKMAGVMIGLGLGNGNTAGGNLLTRQERGVGGTYQGLLAILGDTCDSKFRVGRY
ncbi:hypothetical protein NXX40_05590 [Parabacteroides distasonis]|nr:hypothetical protein [Parabacteroides distasonis]